MPRILLVDDAPALLSAVAETLRRAGFDVVPAKDGYEAVRLIEEQHFDIAVVDYDIPGPSGLDVLALISAKFPNCVGVRASGALDLEIALRAVNHGSVAQVVRKPYRRAELLDAVAAAVAARQGRTLEPAEHRANREALGECFSEDLLSLAVQPIINAGDGTVAAYEALLRSSHALLNGPLPVLTAAEDNGRLHELGARVAELAQGWAERIPESQRLFVNLHPHQLADPDLLLGSLKPLLPYAARIVLEITERSRLDDVGAWRRSTQRLVESGFSLAIDDLGSGFSTLSVLAELKPAVVKVDQSIIRDVDTDEHKRRLLELIAQFAKATCSQLVAEGIETEQEAAVAVACGPEMLQGYYFGRPAFELLDEHWNKATG
ncbi:MAG: EAL domain-containing response regulator [Nannocystaceae bacterium]|nr:EAL domain-containing response regulator [Nannocystaceae bacterium]